MTIAVITLVTICALIFATLYFRERQKLKKLTSNEKLILSYLQIHADLQSNAGALLEIKRVNNDNLMIWRNE